MKRLVRYSFLILIFASLSAFFFPGCTSTWQWVRRGTKVDSLGFAVHRLDSLTKVQNQLLTGLSADVLTEIENLRQDVGQLSAKMDDNQDNLNRVYQRFESPRTTSNKTDTTSAQSSVPTDPDELYNTAYLDYTRADYDVAIEGFKRYLKYFPDTELSDNSQYWIGECYYSKKMYPDAVLEFEKVTTNYPQGNKVVSAFYKMGLAYESMDEVKKAKEYYKKVFDNYPNTPEAKIAQERYNSLP
jgi:tol-pal system protein YbgF